MPKVFLSPSDHGEGKNKCLHSGCYEDKHTRPIAEACAKHLKNSGVDVKIGASNQSLTKRWNDSDAFNADLHIPIHTNAWSDPNTRYLMFMFYADSEKHRKAFNAIAPEIEAIYPGNKKATFSVRKDLSEIIYPSALCVYCELGFHTNKIDCDKFIHNADVVGKALAKGICKYFGIPFVEKKNTEIQYTLKQFVRDVQEAIGAEVDGIAGPETLSKTVTVSERKNSRHPVVKAIQKRLYALGYKVVGQADGIAGSKFDLAVIQFQTDNRCWVDGEITAKNKTWKKLLGME